MKEDLIKEQQELDARIAELHKYMASPAGAILPAEETVRLQNQVYYMSMYSQVLGERIAAIV